MLTAGRSWPSEKQMKDRRENAPAFVHNHSKADSDSKKRRRKCWRKGVANEKTSRIRQPPGSGAGYGAGKHSGQWRFLQTKAAEMECLKMSCSRVLVSSTT